MYVFIEVFSARLMTETEIFRWPIVDLLIRPIGNRASAVTVISRALTVCERRLGNMTRIAWFILVNNA